MTTTFTEKEFLQQLSLFREETQKKSFWDLTDEQRDNFVKEINFSYLNIVNDDGSLPNQEQINKYAMWYQITMNDYSRREAYLVHGLGFGR